MSWEGAESDEKVATLSSGMEDDLGAIEEGFLLS